MRYFFVEPSSIKEQKAVITGSNAHHIHTVLRLKPGDMIRLFDGTGLEYQGRVETLSSNRADVSILTRKRSPSESPVHITVAQALLKGRKMDGLVRQLTELGISRWIPFVADRSVVKPEKDRQLVRMDRWKAIVIEAAKQSKRGQITKIDQVLFFEDILTIGNQHDLGLVFYEGSMRSLQQVTACKENPIQHILIVIGPEGGFTEKEIEKAQKSGIEIVGLGPRILKTETATIAACTLVQFLFGDMG